MAEKMKYTKPELEVFKKIILEQIEETKEIIDHNLSNNSESITEQTGETHTEELGTEHQARELDFYIAQREGKFITNLEGALKRIETGTYGVCRSCGKLIDKKRLKIVPHATLCFDCKNNKERKD
ncbi:MAG: TraR/DksA C4-type zinc finger protein [Candidatus Delongbacteria bacterium]|nr:TraR/DksA C4-type zinc finger protein [Candidatus Delongbacteria bacterium]MDD4205055.1 TraR/DksA C4-type zinc finger protein [Candidatus Delongbacteria bacterium]